MKTKGSAIRTARPRSSWRDISLRKHPFRRLLLSPTAILTVAIVLTFICTMTWGTPRSSAVLAFTDDDHVYRDAEKAIRTGDYQRAITMYADVLKDDQQNLRAHIGTGFAYYKLFNYILCYNEAAAAIKIDDGNARAHAIAGLALLRSGYMVHALHELVKAVNTNPKEALAWGGLAEIDYYENRPGPSRDKAVYAFNLDSTEADFLITYARASSRLEMFGDAADAYERFLQVAPKTDKERRDRIKGLIRFYRQLTGVRLHQMFGAPSGNVPFSLASDHRPYIKVKINGRDATFVVDTGSGFTVVSETSARRLGVGVLARGGTSQGVGGTGKFPIVYGLINSLGLANVKINSVPCFIRPFHGAGKGPEDQADGFIGLSVLSNFVTELDYKSEVMRLTRGAADDSGTALGPGVTVVPFRTTQNGLISVETSLDGDRQINAILDSGASSTVISTAAVKRLDMHKSILHGQTVRVVGAAGITDDVEVMLLQRCQVANLEQDNMRALILDFSAINETSGFEQSGILGGDFLRNFKVTINFAKAQVTLEPQSEGVIRRNDPPILHKN